MHPDRCFGTDIAGDLHRFFRRSVARLHNDPRFICPDPDQGEIERPDALTKLDVLDGFDLVKICVGYKLHGKDLDYFPSHAADQAAVEPIYEEMEGWSGTTAGARSWAQLPAQAIKYIQRVQELIETPVALVSTSPEREDTILVRDPFAD